MSRIAKKPVTLPSGVSYTADAASVTVKGPKGSVTFHKPTGVSLRDVDGGVQVERKTNSKADRAAQGLVVRLLSNAAQGTVEPYKRILDIVGVGFQARVAGKQIGLKVGYANEIMVNIPDGVSVDLPSATRITLTSCDKHLVGQLAANVRAARPPEPYNGKGIKYEEERIVRKAGKSFASGG